MVDLDLPAPAAAINSCGVYTGKQPTALPDGWAAFHAATVGRVTSVVSAAHSSTSSSQLRACSQEFFMLPASP